MYCGDRFYASRESGIGEVGGFRHGLGAAGCRNEIWAHCVLLVTNVRPGMKLRATPCVDDDMFRRTVYDL